MAKAKTKHDLKDTKSGKFVSKKPSWTAPGPQGFHNWRKEIKPRILNHKNRYEVFTPTADQKKVINQILAVDEHGNFVHDICTLIGPRRHFKTVTAALIIIFLTTSRKNYLTQLLGNNETHCRRTMFRTVARIIINTPKLSQLIDPDKYIKMWEIYCPKTKSTIQMSSTSFAGSFGEKANILWYGDAHSSPDHSSFNAFLGSLLDSENSLCLVDGNPDEFGGFLHKYEKNALVDDGIFCNRIKYKDFQEYEKKAPVWIDRKKAKRLETSLLESEFKRDILGLRSSVVNSLFPESVIKMCKDSYRCPVDNIKDLVGNRSYVIGGGLDRADSEWGSVFGNDNSVFTTVAKVANPENQEPEIYILDQHCFRPSTGRAIKKHVLAQHKKYKFKNVVLEAHNVSDLQPYFIEAGVPCESINPHATVQRAAWPEVVRIAKTGRLRISNDLPKLLSEMSTMTYTKLSSGNYHFGAVNSSQKDDRGFSLLWSVYSLRNQILSLYTLGNIQCKNKSSRRHSCFLMGGSLVLLCSENCQAYNEVKEHFQNFLQFQTETEMTIVDFFHAYVKVMGATIYQAA